MLNRYAESPTKLPSSFLWIRLCNLLHFDGVIDDQVHELIKTLRLTQLASCVGAFGDLASSDVP